MKTVLTIILSILLAACPTDIKPSKIAASTSPQTYEKKDVCQLMNIDKVTTIMGWQASNVMEKQLFSFENYNFSACQYTNERTSEFVMLKTYHKSDKAIKNKVLEQQFSSFLKTGNQGYRYEEIEGDGTQSILGIFENRGSIFYHLRTRIENKYEFSSEISTTSTEKDVVIEKLKKLVTLMH